MLSETSQRPDVPVTTMREDIVTTGFGLWMIIGLFVDGWAHLNRPGLETFFTPWHGVLYSGFAANAAWLFVLAARGHRSGLTWAQALPRGYRLGAAGVLLFGVGGLGDMLWHVVLGVETGIDALLSPTHLVLLSGGALALTSALRAGWARSVGLGAPRLRDELPAVLSLTLVTALGAFFLLYVSVFTDPAAALPYVQFPEGSPEHDAAEFPVALGVASYLVSTVLLVLPLLLAEQQDRRPRGAVVVLVGAVAVLSAAVDGFTAFGLTAAVFVTVSAVVVEVVIGLPLVADLPAGLRAPVVGAAVPTLLWPAQLTAVALTEGMGWPVELWAGVVVLSALVGATLGVLVAWRPIRARPTRARDRAGRLRPGLPSRGR